MFVGVDGPTTLHDLLSFIHGRDQALKLEMERSETVLEELQVAEEQLHVKVRKLMCDNTELVDCVEQMRQTLMQLQLSSNAMNDENEELIAANKQLKKDKKVSLFNINKAIQLCT